MRAVLVPPSPGSKANAGIASSLNDSKGAARGSETTPEASIPTVEGGENLDPGGVWLNGTLFYRSEMLTQRPAVLSVGEFESSQTKKMIVSGALVLQIWIDGTGKVVQVLVEDSGLPQVFADAAKKAFMAASFSPGTLGDQLVGSVVRMEVRYDDERLARPGDVDVPQSN